MGRGEKLRQRDAGLALLLGVVGALSFPLVVPPLGTTPLFETLPRELGAFICIAGLFCYARSSKTLKEKFWFGTTSGFSFFAVLLYWLTIAMSDFGEMPWWQVIFVFTLLVSYCACYWGLGVILIHKIGPNSPLAALAFASSWVLVEYCRGFLLTGFPWGELGYSQARVLPLAQWASIGGVHAVTFLVALGGSLIGNIAASIKTKQAFFGVAHLALFAFISWGGGVLLLNAAPKAQSKQRIGIVQGNIKQSLKNKSNQHRQAIIRRYRNGSLRALEKRAEVLIWPEAAWPAYINTQSQYFSLLELDSPVYIGAPSFALGPQRRHFNSVFWVEPDGTIGGRQDKNHLVPFGEYVPLRWLLPVNRFVPGLVDFSAGSGISPLGEPPAGVLICFDGVFPEFAREAVQNGATWLINSTNDAWYGVSSAPYQHLDFYIFRAIENRRWIARAANTGISAVIDAKGQIRAKTELNSEDTIVSELIVRSDLSIYGRFGDRWLIFAGLLFALLRWKGPKE